MSTFRGCKNTSIKRNRNVLFSWVRLGVGAFRLFSVYRCYCCRSSVMLWNPGQDKIPATYNYVAGKSLLLRSYSVGTDMITHGYHVLAMDEPVGSSGVDPSCRVAGAGEPGSLERSQDRSFRE